MSKNLRITFTDKDRDVEMTEYLDTKCNPRAFIKDLIYREMLRDKNYINCSIGQNNQNQSFVTQNTQFEEIEKEEEQNFEFDIDDLDL